MFIAAFSITAKTWKQPRCPSLGDWIKKLWYIQTMEYYSVLKRNGYQAVKRHGENLNAYYQMKEASVKYCMIPITWHSGKDKTIETMFGEGGQRKKR